MQKEVFHCGDPVMAFDFLHSPNWKPGVVEEILGPVSYRIQLLDGRTWRRHVDHLKLRYKDFGNGKPQMCLVPQPLPHLFPQINLLKREERTTNSSCRTFPYRTSG